MGPSFNRFGKFSKQANKLKSLILPMLGIFLMVVFLGAVWFWESYGREMYVYSQVIVASEDIKEGTPITQDMIAYEKIETTKIIKGDVTDPNAIIGKVARHFIPKLAQMHDAYVIAPDLMTDKDHFITPIPKEWIKAIPNTLRRGDTAYICFVNSNLFVDQNANIKSTETDQPITRDSQGNIIQSVSPAQVQAMDTIPDAPEIKTVIAYVKDSANREVVTLSDKDRYDGSAAISELDLNLTDQEFQTIKDEITKGSRLIIKYKENEEAGSR